MALFKVFLLFKHVFIVKDETKYFGRNWFLFPGYFKLAAKANRLVTTIKSHIRETPNLLTNADRITDTN